MNTRNDDSLRASRTVINEVALYCDAVQYKTLCQELLQRCRPQDVFIDGFKHQAKLVRAIASGERQMLSVHEQKIIESLHNKMRYQLCSVPVNYVSPKEVI